MTDSYYSSGPNPNLHRLAGKPATLTHLGQMLGEHLARVRHHLKKREEAGLVEISEASEPSDV